PIAVLIVVGALAFVARVRRSDDVRRRRAWTHAAVWTAVGFYISFPASVRVGRTLVHLPTVAAISGAVRVPQRLGVAAVIGTALPTGLAFAECLRWLPGRGRATALATRVVAAAVLAAALYRGYAAGVEHEYLGIGFDPSFAPRKPDAVRHPYPLAPAVA